MAQKRIYGQVSMKKVRGLLKVFLKHRFFLRTRIKKKKEALLGKGCKTSVWVVGIRKKSPLHF